MHISSVPHAALAALVELKDAPQDQHHLINSPCAHVWSSVTHLSHSAHLHALQPQNDQKVQSPTTSSLLFSSLYQFSTYFPKYICIFFFLLLKGMGLLFKMPIKQEWRGNGTSGVKWSVQPFGLLIRIYVLEKSNFWH